MIDKDATGSMTYVNGSRNQVQTILHVACRVHFVAVCCARSSALSNVAIILSAEQI